MVGYLTKHEAEVRKALATADGDFDWAGLARCHGRRVGYLQAERLVHLVVMLFVALFALLCFLSLRSRPDLGGGALLLLFLGLLVPYIAHYFRLENGVQRLYVLADEIARRAEEIPDGLVRQ